MSWPNEERAIIDAELKALAFDSGPPAQVRSVSIDMSSAFIKGVTHNSTHGVDALTHTSGLSQRDGDEHIILGI
jgi:hypothetical protein